MRTNNSLVREDLELPAMDQFIVAKADRAFAYLQCYDQAAWPENGLGFHPQATRGIDQFIGESDMIDRGHGSAFIRAFGDDLLRRERRASLTDPDPSAYTRHHRPEKAGFCSDRVVDTPDGRALLMVRNA